MTDGATVDFARLTLDLLKAEASEAEMKVCLAVAHNHGAELSVRDVARLAVLSVASAEAGIRRAEASNRLRRIEVRTLAQ